MVDCGTNMGRIHCNATFDSIMCWPPTAAGAKTSQRCPAARLTDTNNMAYRRCSEAGAWLDKKGEPSARGWTNYTPCFPSEVQKLLGKVAFNDDSYAQAKFDVAERTRNMEIVGCSISLVALMLSLLIFSYFRCLRNTRTRIHKSLFSAMLVQVLVRLTVYIDQALTRDQLRDLPSLENITVLGIDNMPYLCEGAYVMLEYAITAMCMWMFIEGLYLHRVVTTDALREKVSHVTFHVIGWGLPVINTGLWASLTASYYHGETVKRCWFGYNFTKLYWIVQGPRLGVIIINLVFLLNIMRVLIVKLRQSQSSEVEKVRKAVKAALALLPLLGITNSLAMLEAPLDKGVWTFAAWSYTTHFLRSFQGFFVALIYCFLNGEVRKVIKKYYADYMAMRDGNRRYWDSWFNSGETWNEKAQSSEDCVKEIEISILAD